MVKLIKESTGIKISNESKIYTDAYQYISETDRDNLYSELSNGHDLPSQMDMEARAKDILTDILYSDTPSHSIARTFIDSILDELDFSRIAKDLLEEVKTDYKHDTGDF